jgi:hypothetical protein
VQEFLVMTRTKDSLQWEEERGLAMTKRKGPRNNEKRKTSNGEMKRALPSRREEGFLITKTRGPAMTKRRRAPCDDEEKRAP